MGRKATPNFTNEQLAQVEALGAFLSLEQIADYFGIGKTAFYALAARQPEISERYKKGRARAIGSVAQGLIQQARDGNLTAMIFYLKTQAGWRETEKAEEADDAAPPAVEVKVVSARKKKNADAK